MKSGQLACGALVLLLLGGCGAYSTTRIEAQDRQTVLPALRGSFNFGKSVDAPSRPQDGHSIEVEGFTARGNDNQSLAAGQNPVVLDGTTFAPPVQLRHDFRFSYADVSWRWRKFFGGGAVGLQALAGVAYAGVRLNTSSPSQQASQGFYNRGAQGGFGLVWRNPSGTAIEARVTEFFGGESDVDRASRYEASISQALSDNVTLRLGYAGWEVKGQDFSSNSAYRLRFSGPTLGLQVDFGP
ncbi:MAG: hypothetical protein ABL900_14355 [Burkholderiaceae bacterium]